MKEYESIIAEVGLAFAEVKRDFAPDGVRCIWLKREQQKSTFIEITEFDDFYIKWNKFESMMEFWLATNEVMNDFAAQSSFLAYGVPDDADKLDVYEFEKKYVIAPSFGDPLWKVLAVRVPKERYTVTNTALYLTVGGEFLTVGGTELSI